MNTIIAAAQIDSVVGDIEKNISTHVRLIRDAIKRKAGIIAFPELSLTGYTLRDLAWECAVSAGNSKLFSLLISLSKKIDIIAGGVEEGSDYALYNSAFLFSRGKMSVAQRKIYLPTYGMFEEHRYFHHGDSIRALMTEKAGKVGILICEDAWHLTLPYILAHDGAEIIFSMAASPTRLKGNSDLLANAQVNYEHHKTFARLLSVFIVFSNRVGFEEGVNYWGGSQIYSPAGEVIAFADTFKEDLIFADVQSNQVRRARRFSRHFIDDNPSFTVQQLLCNIAKKSKYG